jgi:hypothetical protein
MNKPQLTRECQTFARYLAGRPADAYVIGKYLECHGQGGRIREAAGRFDRFLTAVAAKGPVCARIADAYASRFLKYGSLRKKLVLTLALLECAPASFEYLDEVDSAGFAGAILSLTRHAAVYATCLALAILFFLPVQLWMRLMPGQGSARAAAVER